MVENSKVLVTGATGFIGSALVARLATELRWQVVASVRDQKAPSTQDVKVVSVGEVGADTDWSTALQGVDTVVHTAAVAHVHNISTGDQLSRLRMTNLDGALSLGHQALVAGVRRFVFVSSIGVNGNTNVRPFTAGDSPQPAEPYAQSKWEAEQGLWRIQKETGMELVIIRPPLVYGPGAPGNFGSLVRWIGKGLPLPLGAIHNQRSLVGIDNLVDLIIRCIDHPAAANRIFLAGDGEDLSTTELLRAVGKAMGRPARLIPLPASFLRWCATLLGKQAVANRLLGSLQVDISQTCEVLDWKPPFTVEEGLRRCFSPRN